MGQKNKIRPLLFLLLLMLPSHCFAFKAGPAEFKETYHTKEGDLFIRGAGLKKFVQLKVFAAGLYLPAEARSEEALTDISKRLEVVYLLSIPASELHNATSKGIEVNTSAQEYRNLKQRIEQMNSFYPNVKKGDRIEVTYLKGKGTQVSFNGQYLGTIPGADFSKAFFAIWIGQAPVDQRLKSNLLGQKT